MRSAATPPRCAGNVSATRCSSCPCSSTGMQEQLLKLLIAVSEGDSDIAADVAIRISDTSEYFDETQFRHKIGQLVAEEQHSRLADMDLGKLILDVGRGAGETG